MQVEMGARAEVLALLLLFVARLCDCQDLVLVTESEVVIEPSSNDVPPPFTVLKCFVTPNNATIAIRWTLPNGTMIPQGTTDRFFVDQGPGASTLDVILLIEQLSYRDAGVYTCEVMDQTIPDAPWIPATVELQLNVNLQDLGNEVNAMTTDSEATLRCEMADFIRPDEDLQWFRGGQQITNGSRHTVTYEDGRPGVAQTDGGIFAVPARVSVLTISDPVVADSGVYTCQIQGTTESANIQLSVSGGPTSPSTASPSSSMSTPVWIIAPIIVGVLLLFPVGIFVGICINKQKRRHSPSASSHNSPRDIDVKDNVAYGQATPQQPAVMYEEVSTQPEKSGNVAYPCPMYEDISSHNSLKDIELEDNIAYGPASPQQPAAMYEEVSAQADHQKIEMSGNVAYGQISH